MPIAILFKTQLTTNYSQHTLNPLAQWGYNKHLILTNPAIDWNHKVWVQWSKGLKAVSSNLSIQLAAWNYLKILDLTTDFYLEYFSLNTRRRSSFFLTFWFCRFLRSVPLRRYRRVLLSGKWFGEENWRRSAKRRRPPLSLISTASSASFIFAPRRYPRSLLSKKWSEEEFWRRSAKRRRPPLSLIPTALSSLDILSCRSFWSDMCLTISDYNINVQMTHLCASSPYPRNWQLLQSYSKRPKAALSHRMRAL